MTDPDTGTRGPDDGYTKHVTDATGRTWVLFRTSQAISRCSGCNTPVRSGKYVLTCPACVSAFCEDCVADGTYARHQEHCSSD